MNRFMLVVNKATVLVAIILPTFAASHPLADRCELFQTVGVEDSSTQACLRCHGHGLVSPGKNHPVDVDYAAATGRLQGGLMELRPVQEVVARGAFLPNGQIRCVTCHDGRSPWKYGIALPPGAKVKPAVNPGDRNTYEDGPGLKEKQAQLATSSERHTIAVGTKSLCILCHAFD